jgi:uncharacterized protein YdeI (YjbR/CyaY-like superfamily)
MTKLTDRQRDAVDKAVLTAIANAPEPLSSADMSQMPAINRVLSELPKDKSYFWYLDNARQRLRRQGRIEATRRGGRWRVIHGRP